jgi:uncharacterized protein (TIGR02466 family)
MIINNLLSIPVYEFWCEESLTEEIYNQSISSVFFKNISNKISDRDHFYNKKLFDWFDQCTDQVCKIYFKDSISLPITSCWVNKSSKLENHHTHQHPNSVISGIFYLTTHDKAETVFFYKNPFFELGNTDLLRTCKNIEMMLVDRSTTITGKIKPEKGKLILFPSSLVHGTRPNFDLYPRYTVSFNTFFSGKITEQAEETNLTTAITLHPVTVRQLFEGNNI